MFANLQETGKLRETLHAGSKHESKTSSDTQAQHVQGNEPTAETPERAPRKHTPQK